MSIFSQRSAADELMDDLTCSGEVVNRTLNELDTINKWLGGNNVTIEGIRHLLKSESENSITTIADLGCGSGMMLRLVNHWAQKCNHRISLTGVDANPNIVAFATKAVGDMDNANCIALDIFSEEFKKMRFDIVTATLFFHHFNSTQLANFLRQLKDQVKIGFVINDIHRHWFAYHSIRLLTKYFSNSAMVKFDAPLSVLRAFSKKELIDILNDAGLSNFRIRWCWAFRWQVIVKV